MHLFAVCETSKDPFMTSLFTKAERHLSRKAPIFRKIIRQVGPCTLKPNPDYFSVLVHTIVSQQLSTKAALTIGGRLHEALNGKGLTPKAIQRLADEEIRACGLSGGKTKSLRDLCRRCLDNSLPINRLHELSDEEVREHLLEVHGIGPWSVDMYLIFCLGREDVLPVGDFGLKAAVQEHYGLKQLPSAPQLQEIAEPWRPFRTIATWYFWRSRGPVPQS
jgi:DNA-3-methyladenine glycosylase II